MKDESYPSCFNNVVCIPLRLLGAVPSIAQNDIVLHLFSSFFFRLVYTLRDYLGSTATTTQLSCPFRGGTLTGTIVPKDDIALSIFTDYGCSVLAQYWSNYNNHCPHLSFDPKGSKFSFNVIEFAKQILLDGSSYRTGSFAICMLEQLLDLGSGPRLETTLGP